MMKTTLLTTCTVLALACSGTKDPCASRPKVETVKLPAWFAIENAGTLVFEAGQKPVFTPEAGALHAEEFRQLLNEEMKDDGAIGFEFEEVEGAERYFCTAVFRPGQPDYPMAVVYHLALAKGDYEYERLDKAPAPTPEPTPASDAAPVAEPGAELPAK